VEATKNAEESLRLARELKAGEDELVVLVTLIRIHVRRGDFPNALAYLEQVLPLLKTYDFEGAAPEVHAWHAYVLAGLNQRAEALAALKRVTEHPPTWPHIQVRTLLAQGQAHIQLNQPQSASVILTEALEMAEGNGFRYYQLVAHHHLCGVVDDEDQRARHGRIAVSLSRSLAANLGREDSKIFLDRGWGR
jgi:tetratricopeptide (TPR) repeat protein